ncbi:MAG TPA: class II histone deacetylase [Gammaproteobacteria bacterium]|nr:class II histone deacetylase [Gammaproteobacteria bacterium]
MAKRTGLVWHEAYAWYDLGNDAGVVRPDGRSIQPDRHAYDPEIPRRFRNLLEISELAEKLVHLKPRKATEAEIRRVHTQRHVDQIKQLSALVTGGESGDFSPIPHGTFEAALLAAGGALTATDAVMNGEIDNAYALLRPAGHHATPQGSMGFCIFSNAAIAGRHLLETRGLERIAYVDWDVHHGNGTQSAFYDEPRALTISIHQDRCFPTDDGFLEQLGEGAAEGTNINIPLPPGSGVDAYCAAYERVIIPALKAFRPDFIFVPSGFDAGAMDPLGRMMMTSEGYRRLTQKLLAVADEVCGSRLVFTHEGGYSRWAVPFYGLAVMEELSGVTTGVVDPYLEWHSALGGQALLPHQDAVIETAAANVQRVPRRK